jgi:hypothetical protein
VTQGVRRERLLFALLLLIEWYQALEGKRRDLATAYQAAKDDTTAM